MAAISAPDKPVWLDFDAIDARCAELGKTTEPERADLLGIERSFLNRLRRGVVDTTLGRVVAMAERLDVPVADIIRTDSRPRPTSPPPAPKPPSGPAPSSPPSGPRKD